MQKHFIKYLLSNLNQADKTGLFGYYGIQNRDIDDLTESLTMEMVEVRNGTFPRVNTNSETVLSERGYTAVKTPDGNLTVLGKGSFGTVVLYEKDGERVAVKFINKPSTISYEYEKNRNLLKREIAVMKRVSSRSNDGCKQYLACLYEFLESSNHWMIVMEYIEGIEMDKIDRRDIMDWSPADRLEIIRQIMEGVKQIHDVGSAHWDLKPANIMVLPDRSIKIVDFGLGCIENGDVVESRCKTYSEIISGTAFYMSPEVWNKCSTDPKARDIFALGVIVYWILSVKQRLFTGINPQDPYSNPTRETLKEHIVGGTHVNIAQNLQSSGFYKNVANLLEELIHGMVVKIDNGNQRYTIDQCIAKLDLIRREKL